jgi:hypothetical protein
LREASEHEPPVPGGFFMRGSITQPFNAASIKPPLSQNETGRFNKRYSGRLLKRPVWGTFFER